MERKFNTEGQCDPEIHYMVRLDDRLRKIKDQYVDPGSYFIINRGRQYGKTTTLWALRDYLKKQYIVLFLDFQLFGAAKFKNEAVFSVGFARKVIDAFCSIYPQSKTLSNEMYNERAHLYCGTENRQTNALASINKEEKEKLRAITRYSLISLRSFGAITLPGKSARSFIPSFLPGYMM